MFARRSTPDPNVPSINGGGPNGRFSPTDPALAIRISPERDLPQHLRRLSGTRRKWASNGWVGEVRPRAPEERFALIQIKGGARKAQKHGWSVMVLRPSRSCWIRSTPVIRTARSKGAIIASEWYRLARSCPQQHQLSGGRRFDVERRTSVRRPAADALCQSWPEKRACGRFWRGSSLRLVLWRY